METARILSANTEYAANHASLGSARPAGGVAVVTCMDARIDVLPVLGLKLGDAHVIRNAGARVTSDVLRSLALSSHSFGVDTVILMQHTKCGLAEKTNEELQALTGSDLDFLPIAEHRTALRDDISVIRGAPYLGGIKVIVGLIYDVDTGLVEEVERCPI